MNSHRSGNEFANTDEIQRLQESRNVRAYVVDDAYGVGSSTLILNDGTGDIPQADALQFLDMYLIPDSGNYSVVKRNGSGQVDQDLDFDGTAEINNGKLGTDLDANSFRVVNGNRLAVRASPFCLPASPFQVRPHMTAKLVREESSACRVMLG